MTPVAWLRALDSRDYITLLAVTALLCCALGFAGGAVVIVYGPWQQGTGTAPGPVVAGLILSRGDP